MPQALDTVQDAVAPVTTKAKQVVREATNAPAQVVDTVQDVASPVTKKTEQVVDQATKTPAQVVDTVQDVASPVTKKTEEVVREATKTPSQAVETVQDVAAPVTKKTEDVVREATETPTQRPGPTSDEPDAAGSPAIDTAPAKTASASDSDGPRAATGSTARTDDSLQTTQRRATGTETNRAKGNGAPTSVNTASAAGGPVVKANATRQMRGTSVRSSRGITAHRGRGLVSWPSSRQRADLGAVAESSMPAPGSPQLSSEDSGGLGSLGFLVPGFLWPPSFLPSSIELAQWLLHALTALLVCIAVLLASGFWARQRVLKF